MSDETHKAPLIDRRESEVDKEAWHLSKSVPLAFVITLLFQTIVLVSWAATFKAEFVSFRESATRQFTEMRAYVDAKTVDRITEAEVKAELRARDTQLRLAEKHNDRMLLEVQSLKRSIDNKLGSFESKLVRIEDKMDDHTAQRQGNHYPSNGNGNGG